ncbi:MAG: hypothetical protein IPG82_17845 [Saprospiraceae bacterium]|nr:hypothetical protein [Saprospiraceae bacterium]
MKLDGTAKDYERLTFFSDVEGFRASNPVVHDDGNSFVFQASEANSAAELDAVYICLILKNLNRQSKL